MVQEVCVVEDQADPIDEGLVPLVLGLWAGAFEPGADQIEGFDRLPLKGFGRVGLCGAEDAQQEDQRRAIIQHGKAFRNRGQEMYSQLVQVDAIDRAPWATRSWR